MIILLITALLFSIHALHENVEISAESVLVHDSLMFTYQPLYSRVYERSVFYTISGNNKQVHCTLKINVWLSIAGYQIVHNYSY